MERFEVEEDDKDEDEDGHVGGEKEVQGRRRGTRVS